MLNWNKIVGNAIVAFSTAALAVIIIGIEQDALIVGLIAAGLQGLLALGAGLQDDTKPTGTESRLNTLVMF